MIPIAIFGSLLVIAAFVAVVRISKNQFPPDNWDGTFDDWEQ